ncbi:MAG: hypothetical protein ACYS0K_00560 [Planctomycetota bacterium]
MRRVAPLLLLAGFLLGQEPGPADTRLDKANQQAAARVYRTFAKQGKLLSTQFKGLRKEDVIVVGGLFDFVQEVLAAYRLEHTVLTPAELEHHPLPEPERKVFLLNCHLLDRRFPPSQRAAGRASDEEAARRLRQVLKQAGLDGAGAPGQAIRERFAEVSHFAGSDYSQAGLKRLGGAIRAGAWAVSTDWAVLALEKALPGLIRWTGHTTFEEKVEVRPSLAGRRHPLLEDVFPDPAKAKWWIEAEGYLFATGKGRATVLIESRALGARYRGNRSVVVLLEPGRGRVLHALTHGYLQRGKAEDIGVMQKLLLKFLIGKSLQNYERALNAKK